MHMINSFKLKFGVCGSLHKMFSQGYSHNNIHDTNYEASSHNRKEIIQNYVQNQFAGVMFVQKGPSESIVDFFVDYDFWEPYSNTKSYSKKIYQAAYKGTMRNYKDYLYILTDADADADAEDKNEQYYAVAKRIHNELDDLEPYCPCVRCVLFSINPLKYIWCPNCTGCIKSGPGFVKEEYIIKARELKDTMKSYNNSFMFTKYIRTMTWPKLSEFIFLILIITYSRLF